MAKGLDDRNGKSWKQGKPETHEPDWHFRKMKQTTMQRTHFQAWTNRGREARDEVFACG